MIVYNLALIDNDIGSCIDIQSFFNYKDLLKEVKNILMSVDPDFQDDEEQNELFKDFDSIKKITEFKNTDLKKNWWECHFPGNYRYISVHMKEI